MIALSLTLGVLASCAGSTSSAGAPSATRTSTVPSGHPDANGTVHLGCSHYCQQAGGYGGGGVGMPVTEITAGKTAALLPDGSVPIRVTCVIPVPCRGAIVLDFPPLSPTSPGAASYAWKGRSDLELGAHSSGTFAVPLSAFGLQSLRSRGRVTATVTADGGELPPCAKIPALAAECHKYVTAPGYTPDRGDGLERIVSAQVVLSAR